jgi:hypothetical protein
MEYPPIRGLGDIKRANSSASLSDDCLELDIF